MDVCIKLERACVGDDVSVSGRAFGLTGMGANSIPLKHTFFFLIILKSSHRESAVNCFF